MKDNRFIAMMNKKEQMQVEWMKEMMGIRTNQELFALMLQATLHGMKAAVDKMETSDGVQVSE